MFHLNQGTSKKVEPEMRQISPFLANRNFKWDVGWKIKAAIRRQKQQMSSKSTDNVTDEIDEMRSWEFGDRKAYRV